MFDPSHIIDVPPFSVKLALTMRTGDSYEGTGFCVKQGKRLWLLTCWHNIENRKRHFKGKIDLQFLQIFGGRAINLNEDRAIVGIRVDGVITDCAAIEISQDEWGPNPKFDSETAISVRGPPLPPTITIRSPPLKNESVDIKPIGWIILQGYPGGHSSPITLIGARAHCLPHFIQPWMIVSIPASTHGFSGGPLMDVRNDSMSLFGIATHIFKADFNVKLEDGRVAKIGLQASAAMPINPLLWVLRYAPEGVSIIDVAPPVHKVPVQGMI